MRKSVIVLFCLLGFLAPAFAAPAGASAGVRVSCRQGRIRLTAVNADLHQVLTQLGDAAGIRMVIGNGVTGRITLRLSDVSVEAALRALSKNTAIIWEKLPGKAGYRIVAAAAAATRPGPTSRRTTGKRISDAPAAHETSTVDVRAKTGKTHPRFVPGELLVAFRTDAPADRIDALHRQIGARVLGVIQRRRLYRVRLPKGMTIDAAIKAYQASGLVRYAEPNALRYPQGEPDDPRYADQWGLAQISAPAAWAVTQGSRDVIVAVIDTGVDYTHADLAADIYENAKEVNGVTGKDDDGNGYVDDLHGWDFGNNDNDPMDVDIDGHGTHVAGIIGAVGNNAVGVSGVNWRVSILPLKIADINGDMSAFSVVEAMDYALAMGAAIVNCSFDGDTFSQAEYNALSDLSTHGILVVAAAGNNSGDDDLCTASGTTTCPGGFPAAYDLPNIVSVAASSSTDALSYYSNYGAISVDLAAPGDAVLSTLPTTAVTDASVRVNTATATATFSAIGMAYAGTTDAAGVSGTLVDCGLGQSGDFPAAVSGNIALIARGSITFRQKALNAMNAGAVAAIIANNTVDSLDTYGGTLIEPGGFIPVISVTQADGAVLAADAALAPPPTVIVFNLLTSVTQNYGELSGTSMASPMVAGAAALMRARDESLQAPALKAALMASVDPVAAMTGKTVTGGRLNLQKALCSVTALPADVNGNRTHDLADAILALEIANGMAPSGICTPAGCITSCVDVDGDGAVGSAEAIYTLQSLAGFRQ